MRRNVLKNVVTSKLMEIRILKRKPKLKDLLKKFEGMDKEFVADKLTKMYSKDQAI